MLLYFAYLTLLHLLLPLHASSLPSHVPVLQSRGLGAKDIWPPTPFEYRSSGKHPSAYVLHMQEVTTYLDPSLRTVAQNYMSKFAHIFNYFNSVTSQVNLTSTNFELTFQPWRRAVDGIDASNCASQFEEAQRQYGAKNAIGLCAKGSAFVGAIGLRQRSGKAKKWPSAPFTDTVGARYHELTFTRLGLLVNSFQVKSFQEMLYEAERQTLELARKPVHHRQNRHVRVTVGAAFQFDFTWSPTVPGDDVLHLFYVFRNAQYYQRYRCAEARWDDAGGRWIGDVSIRSMGSALPGSAGTRGGELPTVEE